MNTSMNLVTPKMQDSGFDFEFLTLIKSLWKMFIKTRGEIIAAMKITPLCQMNFYFFVSTFKSLFLKHS